MPLWGLLLMLLWAAESRADVEGYEIVATQRTSSIHVDGRLEAVWLAGGKADKFIQREPDYPAPATHPAEVYVLYDEDALYVGYMMHDTSPDSIRGQIQRRDNDANSDFLDLYLDTFHDQRAGYWFTVTAAGVQAEGTFYNENWLSASWDAVWESAVAITDSGWSCELRIPFQILRHGGPRPDGWGISFARKLYRRNEANFWPPVDPELGWRATKMGVLKGLDKIAPSAHVEILPHVVGRWDAPVDYTDPVNGAQEFRSENEWENVGLTLKYVPSADLSIDAAYQPDFAQVDVDEAVINLSDYPVFLSEKRPFFLESKEFFEETPYTFVYTRRVADPDYGGRLNFQKGRYKASFLAAKNRLAYLDENFEVREKLQDAFFGRTTVNLGRHRLGITGTYLGQTDYTSAAAGADMKFRWRERDALDLWLSAVERDGNPVQYWDRVDSVQDEQPVEARVGYTRDLAPVRFQLAAAYRGTDYDANDLGWSEASNSVRQAVWIGNNYYLDGTSLRNIGFDLNGFRRTMTDGAAAEGYGNFNVFTTTRTNWELGGGMEWGDVFRRNYVFDINTEPHEFRDNFGGFNHEYYKYYWHWCWFWSDQTKPFRYGTDARYRTFRDGNAYALEPEITWRPRSNIETGFEMDWTRVWDSRSFTDDLGAAATTDFRNWILKVNWSPSLKLSFRGTVQWIEKSYYSDQGLSFTNLLMSYNWQPGSWVYLVYDEAARDIDRFDHVDRSVPGARTLRAKLTYFFTAP